MDKWIDATVGAVAEAKQNVTKAIDDVKAEKGSSPGEYVSSPSGPLFETTSHIDGKNAKVRLWPDRLEWQRGRGISTGKITAGVMTAGVSLLVTGVRGGKDAYDMVQLKNVTSVSNRKDGVLYHAVEVQAASGGAINSIVFRVSRAEAAKFREAILNAMKRLEQSARTVTHIMSETPAPPTPSPMAAPQPDVAEQLHKLAGLRDAGILTEEEFAEKRAALVARL